MTDSTNTQCHPLISGTFSPDDAVAVLLELFNHKISFHQRKIMTCKERLGRSDPASEQRIEELRETKAAVARLIEKAVTSEAQLAIHCDVQINLVET